MDANKINPDLLPQSTLLASTGVYTKEYFYLSATARAPRLWSEPNASNPMANKRQLAGSGVLDVTNG
jgi:hypothetical protein